MARTERKTRDFSRGPLFDQQTRRYLVEVRWPDGSRTRKRFRREREARRWWSGENARIDSGAWKTAKRVTFGAAVTEYRRHSQAHNRSHVTYIEPGLKVWGAAFASDIQLSEISTRQIENVKLDRVEQVSKSTVDRNVAVLKAFFNWCITNGLASSNPVKPVKLFRPSNEVVRYLLPREYRTLVQEARRVEKSPFLAEKIQLAPATGLRRGNLFNLRWDNVDLLNRVIRVSRTKGGRNWLPG